MLRMHSQQISDRIRVMVMGGYGAFGSKICEQLSKTPNLHVIIAGQ